MTTRIAVFEGLAGSPSRPQKRSDAARVRSMWRGAEQWQADRDRTFVEIMRGPNPLTREEVRRLAAKHPEKYQRYVKAYGGAPSSSSPKLAMSSCAGKWRAGHRLAPVYTEHMTICLRRGAGASSRGAAQPAAFRPRTTAAKGPQGDGIMAKKHRKSCRRMGGLVAVPGLGSFPASVDTKNVLAGGALGAAGAVGGVWLANKLDAMLRSTDKKEAVLPKFVLKLAPLIGSALVGGVALAAQWKSKRARGQAHLLGAVTAGTGLTAFAFANDTEWAGKFTSDAKDVGTVRKNLELAGLTPVYYGDVYVRDQRRQMADVYVRDSGQMAHYADRPQLAGVMASAMDGESDDEDLGLGMLAAMASSRRR